MLRLLLAFVCLSACAAALADEKTDAVQKLIPWLLDTSPRSSIQICIG